MVAAKLVRSALVALCVCSSMLVAGCGDGKGQVQGQVSFDGQPVAKGMITFIRTDGTLTREGAVIKDGAFQASRPPGKYKIELNAQKVVGKRTQKGFGGELEVLEITEEMFPEWYNSKSELIADIKSGGDKLDLHLKSKK